MNRIIYPYHYAEYTIQLRDVLTLRPTLLDNFQLKTQEQTDKFKEIFIAMWSIYEISGETIDEFSVYIDNVFKCYKDYYQELIDTYETKINFLDGKKISISYNEQINIDSDLNREGYNEDKIYGLPNKVTSVDYLTAKERNDVDTNENYVESNVKNRSIETTGGESVISLKREYLALVRNLYTEFSKEFQKCFITMY